MELFLNIRRKQASCSNEQVLEEISKCLNALGCEYILSSTDLSQVDHILPTSPIGDEAGSNVISLEDLLVSRNLVAANQEIIFSSEEDNEPW